jgi:hypothetical protein
VEEGESLVLPQVEGEEEEEQEVLMSRELFRLFRENSIL